MANYNAKDNTIVVTKAIGNIEPGIYPVDKIKEIISSGVELPEEITSLIPSDNDKYKNLEKKEESNLPFEPNKIFTQ